MINNFIATPSRTRDILDKYNFSFKKNLGQNFLIDVNILQNIATRAGITEDAGVIEIGPGIGALTEQLALRAHTVVAYEVDQRLLPILNDTLHPYENVHVLHEDILEANIQETIENYFEEGQPVHIVANLPYYITTPILMKLLLDKLSIESITVMIQKEVADRMSAEPNSKSYGSLSIAIQYYSTAEIVMDVPRDVFRPQPNVDSSVLKLTMRETPPVNVLNEDYFFRLTRACFAHRRKTLRNNLISFFKHKYEKNLIQETLQASGIDGGTRAESLNMNEFAQLANTFYQAGLS